MSSTTSKLGRGATFLAAGERPVIRYGRSALVRAGVVIDNDGMATPRQAGTTDTWTVGVDGSRHSTRALKWSARHAPGRASTIRIVRAWDLTTVGGLEFGSAAVADLKPEHAYELEAEFSSEVESLGVTVESSVVYGTATGVLLAASESTDLLVLGSRGHGGFKRLLLGSTSHQCATHAQVPVAVVPETVSTDRDVAEIVVGMDGSPGAQAALLWAIRFAAPSTTISVVGAWHSSAFAGADEAVMEAGMARAHEEFAASVDEVERIAGCARRSERRFQQGHPAQVLLDAASAADVLVVGERGHRGLRAALLGSTATEVLHRAACATVIVPVGDRSDDRTIEADT